MKPDRLAVLLVAIAATVLVAILVLLVASLRLAPAVTSSSPAVQHMLEPEELEPIPRSTVPAPVVPSPSATAAAREPGPELLPSPSPSPTIGTRPAPTVKPRTASPPRPTRRVSGTATWYCSASSPCTRGYPAGTMAAAAGAELRVGNWRGRIVTVTAPSTGRSVRVRLVDTCACGGARVIDLYAAAFRALGAPLSRGVLEVTVRW